ncbi:MAG TPA: carboxypeptidase-like regulatory domain-containing protein [Gemmatimonadaceae bacterium]
MSIRAIALLLCLPAALVGQSGAVVGVLVAGTGEPLPYGVVAIDGTKRSMFANDSGHFAFYDIQPGRHVLHAKRLGFGPADLIVDVRAGVVDTVRIALTRVTVRLDGVTLTEHPACTAPGIPSAMDTSLKAIVAQLQLNAEQLRFMSEEYPFEYYLQVLKARTLNNGDLFSEDPRTKRYTSKTGSTYRPGEVLKHVDGAWVFQIPELQDVASPQFLASHCWHYAGTDTILGRQHYRLDVVAAEKLSGVDIDGSFYIDTATFQIRRSVVRLSRRPLEVRAVMAMEMTTYYEEILPSVPIIANVSIVQTMDPSAHAQYRESREVQHAHSYRFLDRTPGDSLPPRRKP